jgi:NhaA family Na+:H+ antiporter
MPESAERSPPSASTALPAEPIHHIVSPLRRFLHVETASGIVLLVATAIALVLANSPLGPGYRAFWETRVGLQVGSSTLSHSLQDWINDGLMVIFFFVIGLEVKREVVVGELRDVRRASLPLAAALGGMMMPAGIFLMLQHSQPGEHGWGIPMATDIAFVVGCIALLGPRVPPGLRIMLLSLAIADDIGAILVIALRYTAELHGEALLAALGLVVAIVLTTRLGVRSLRVYAVLGFLLWAAFLESGVHATLAGVILGLLTPARTYLGENAFTRLQDWARRVFEGDWENVPHRAETIRRLRWAARETISPLEYLEQSLHPWVAFVIMPVFALANAGVPLQLGAVAAPVSVAVMLGLLIGKPAGILLASWLAVRTGLAKLPEGVHWRAMAGAGCLAGIGFTMALFIAGLALPDPLLDTAKVGILMGSVLSAALGMVVLLTRMHPRPDLAEAAEP